MDNVLNKLSNSTAAEVRQMSKLQKVKPQIVEEIDRVCMRIFKT